MAFVNTTTTQFSKCNNKRIPCTITGKVKYWAVMPKNERSIWEIILFCICCNFGIPAPFKISLWLAEQPGLFTLSSGYFAAALDEVTSRFCGTPSFRVHMLRLYKDAYARRLTGSSELTFSHVMSLVSVVRITHL